jgi:hypothetical protein
MPSRLSNAASMVCSSSAADIKRPLWRKCG